MTVREIENHDLWDDFVRQSPQGTVFSTSAWIRAGAAAQGGVPRFAGVWKKDRLVAGTAYVHLQHGPLKKATTPVLTPYGGLLFRPDPGKRRSEAESFNQRCAEQLASYLHDEYNYILLANAPGMEDIRPFSWAGWHVSVRYTYQIDITDTSRVWDLMERRVRTVIRNAQDTLVLGDAVPMDDFAALYERIYCDRGGTPPIPRDMVTGMVGAMMDEGVAAMRSVRNQQGDVLSVMVQVHDASRVYAWISGSLPGENNSGAFSLLFWDAILRHAGSHAGLDMVGANIPSIAFFKKGFGGTLTPYYVAETWSSPLARAAFSAYGALKRII